MNNINETVSQIHESNLAALEDLTAEELKEVQAYIDKIKANRKK